MAVKKLSILGSTGSIGTNTLDVVKRFPERFKVLGLSAGHNIALISEQIRRFRPRVVSVATESEANVLKEEFSGSDIEILYGTEGLVAVSTIVESDMVVSAIVGAAGLIPTYSAIKAKKDIAIANKEALVMAGELIISEANKQRIRLLPVDSEHSAIFQCLAGHNKDEIYRIILTASGGPFLDYSDSELRDVKPDEALKHPTWKMGKKITIDSATLMNKGFEVIEARWLFNIEPERIRVLINPESIIHSAVEYIDGSVIAQMSLPDMRGPIAYALSYPERTNLELPRLDLAMIKHLTFIEPDMERFPCLKYAYNAINAGGIMPTVLNAANEVAVNAFLNHRLKFTEIPEIIISTMERHKQENVDSIDAILFADRLAREEAEGYIKSRKEKTVC
ncbi:MAG: 1-deoxy-D-xylulose-5-phosphate reductoisomerase [Nitrospirota bacterium]